MGGESFCCLVSLTELRSCVKVEVAVLGSPSLLSLMVSVDVKPHERRSVVKGVYTPRFPPPGEKTKHTHTKTLLWKYSVENYTDRESSVFCNDFS